MADKPTLESLTAELQALAEQEVQKAELVRSNTALSREGVERAQAELQKIKRRVERKRSQVERVQVEVRKELERRQRELREQISRANRAMSEALEPIEKVMRNLNEGLTSMGLYLGRGEQIFTICEGQRASDIEPIIIRQMVLAMDEETGIFAEDDGINADNVYEFDEWLLRDERHVQQIVPEQKCVVALVPRWRARKNVDEYEEPQEDSLTHFLIRNGNCLFRTSVQFSAGDRLIPAPDEFVQFFKRKRYNFDAREDVEEAIKPGTEEYVKAMEQSNAQSRHYLRIGLILQGLVDRTQIFHPLHPAGINMLSDPSEHSEKVRIITDGEGGLASGLPTFAEWRAEATAHLRVGMRIVGAFGSRDFYEANSSQYGTRRTWPDGAEAPPDDVPLVLERGQDGFDFKVRYPRTQDIWDPHAFQYRQSKVKAFCLLDATDSFILPYDLTDAALMERFLGDRRSRRDYKQLWPLMRVLWRAKQQEEAEEAPFRTMLAGVLARENKVDVAQAETDIPSLIQWFKLSNRYHRPLLVEDGIKAVRLIAAEHARRIRTANRRVDWDVIYKLAQLHPGYILIARPRRGGYIVLVAEEPDRNIFVAEHVYHASGEHKQTRRWRTIGSRAERWMICLCGEAPQRWREWDTMADPQEHLTGPEREALVVQIRKTEDNILAVTQTKHDGPFEAWSADLPKLDPSHPLSQPEERRYALFSARTWHWQRKGLDAPTLYRGESHNWVDDDKKMPWDASRWRKESCVLWATELAATDVAEARRLESDAKRYIDGATDVYDRIYANIERSWFARETEREHQIFLRTGHEDDWPQRAQQLKLKFPYGHSRFTTDPLSVALRLALDEGLVVGGMLVEDMFAATLASPQAVRDYDGDDCDVEVCPESLRGLTISLDLSEPEEPDQESEEDEEESEDIEANDDLPDVAGMVREHLNDVLSPEPEPEQPIASFDGVDVLDAEE